MDVYGMMMVPPVFDEEDACAVTPFRGCVLPCIGMASSHAIR
jgi:hypothetical protein